MFVKSELKLSLLNIYVDFPFGVPDDNFNFKQINSNDNSSNILSPEFKFKQMNDLEIHQNLMELFLGIPFTQHNNNHNQNVPIIQKWKKFIRFVIRNFFQISSNVLFIFLIIYNSFNNL